MVSLGTYPQRINNVVNIDGYYMRPWLMEWIGAICTRKFTTDFHLIKSIRKVLSRGDVFCMYPEARYSPCGTTSYIPETVGALVKRCKVPVVVAIHHGNYLHAPFWNFRNKRKVPLHTTFTKVLSQEDIETLSTAEINKRIREAFVYDDYKYQKDNNILITEPTRAEGMHKILYKCPSCKTEFKMASKGAEIFCTECNKRWTLLEDGNLQANSGETEFSHVPDWFEWERSEVRREVEEGSYSFTDEVDVYSLPHCYKFRPLGKATLTHTINEGFVLSGHHRGKDYKIVRQPIEMNSLHVEYDFPHVKPFDCIDISTEHDSFYCYPTKENVVTKLAFATEEIYQLALFNKRGRRDDMNSL
jgi:DNA-directed RNA polymerase subunit RPC12/RpoP